MRNDAYASSEDYIEWLCFDRLGLTEKEYRSYSNLIHSLSTIEYIWEHPLDENRAIDGLDLRKDFTYEMDLYLDANSGLMPKCTVLEMLVALSVKCENRIMRDLSYGDRTSKWFFEMLENSGLLIYSNNKWNRNTIHEIFDKLNDIFDGRYKKDGSGGFFPIKNKKIDQRNNDLWKQMTTYLREKYIDNESNLELYLR